MDDKRIQDYRNLIQQLLHCPSGEEPAILQANSDLLDLGFVQVCEAEMVSPPPPTLSPNLRQCDRRY